MMTEMCRSRALSLVFVLGLLGCTRSHAPSIARAPAALSTPAASLPPAPSANVSASALSDARHLLNRCAFGPKPGEVERVARLGSARWLDEQLAGPAESPLLEAALLPYQEAYAPPAQLVSSWLGDDWQEEVPDPKALRAEAKPHFKDHARRLATAELTRHILSQRELEEVMVDFWANHFNVYASKGFVRLFAGDYLERAIRPNALGRFSDLLLATARHPAMLLYLDNAESRKPAAARAGAGRSVSKAKEQRGLNENYARELLELHTLGVDGGYSQADVTNVARIFTGWSVTRLKEGKFSYQFRPGAHDRTEKTVLGQVFPAGQGEEEGLRLLQLLAESPATAHHISGKLCARFVADEPPASCVQAASDVFLSSHGDLRQVLKALVSDASFWDASARDNKLKAPLEFVASVARAFGAVPDGSLALADTLQHLGEPLLEERVPTGYPETEPEWSGGGALLARMSFAAAFGSGKASGLAWEVEQTLPATSSVPNLVSSLNQVLFVGADSARTERVVSAQLARLEEPEARRAAAIALFVGSPDFQRQ
jgi:uncharacterized protein (DUF1800 family)